MSPERLNRQEAAFYERVYAAARAGSMSELRRAGCTEEEAEDAFSAALVTVMEKGDPIGRRFAEAQMVNLIKTASRHRSIDARRHKRAIPMGELREANAVDRAAPDETVANRATLELVVKAVGALPEGDRPVFWLNLRGFTPKEIQRLLPGLSARSYRKRIQRANRRVSEACGEIEGDRRRGPGRSR